MKWTFCAHYATNIRLFIQRTHIIFTSQIIYKKILSDRAFEYIWLFWRITYKVSVFPKNDSYYIVGTIQYIYNAYACCALMLPRLVCVCVCCFTHKHTFSSLRSWRSEYRFLCVPKRRCRRSTDSWHFTYMINFPVCVCARCFFKVLWYGYIVRRSVQISNHTNNATQKNMSADCVVIVANHTYSLAKCQS